MITDSFYINNDEEMMEVKAFIRQNMPTARFIQNPYRHSDGKWHFYINYEISDINKLSPLLNKYHLIANPTPPEKNILKSILNRLQNWVLSL